MSNVRALLAGYSQMTLPPTLGGGVATTSHRRTALRRQLELASRHNTIFFAICFGAVLAVLVAAGAFILQRLDSPGTVRTTLAALGISVTGLTAQMASLWKQKVFADTVAALCAEVPESDIKVMIDALLKKL